MSAELLKSAVERAGRLKVLSLEVLSVSAVSLILAKKEVFSMTAYKEACQNNPKSGYLHLLFFFLTNTIHPKMYEHFIYCCIPSSLHSA